VFPTNPAPTRPRVKQAAPVLAVIGIVVLIAILGLQRSAGAQNSARTSVNADVVAQTAEIADSLDIDVIGNPRLYGAIAQVEKWALEAEAEVERRQAIVTLAENAAVRMSWELQGDELELKLADSAARSDRLSAQMVELRDQRAVIEDKVALQTEALAAAEARREFEIEQLGHDLDALIQIWSDRQRILSDLAIHLSPPSDQIATSGRQFDGAVRARPESDEALADRVLGQMAAAQQADLEAAASRQWVAEPVTANEPTSEAFGLSGSSIPTDTATLRWPAIGAVNSGFGMRVHPIYRRNIMHTGVDIDAPWGDAVLAVRDGTVTEAQWKGGYGKAVSLDWSERPEPRPTLTCTSRSASMTRPSIRSSTFRRR